MLICGKLKILMAVVCCALFVSTLRADRRPMFTPVGVALKFLIPPRVKAGALSTGTQGRLSLYNRRWCEIEIDYTPRYDFEEREGRKRSRYSGHWLDDVVLGVQVVVRDALGSTSRRPMGAALLSIRTAFWSIALDGKVHSYFVYIPPQLLERCMPSRDGRTVNVAAAKDFAICVTFFHKKWGVLGRGYYGLKERQAGVEFRELMKTVPSDCVFHGSLVSRPLTPWGLNGGESYDLEKPGQVAPPLDDAAIEKAAEQAEAVDRGGVPESKSGKRKHLKK